MMEEELKNEDAQSEAPVAQSEAPVAPIEAPVAQSEAPVAQSETPVAQSETPVAQSEATINIPVSLDNLNKSAVAVNANILANLVLYKSILTKIKEETDDISLDSKISVVENMLKTSKDLLQLIQTSLNIPEDQQIDEETVVEKSKGDIEGKFKMFNVAESLGFLGLGLALLGGKKRNHKSFTRKAQKKQRKNTKVNKK